MLTGGKGSSGNGRLLLGIGATVMVVILLAAFICYSVILSNTEKLAAQIIAETESAFERVEPFTSEEAEALRTYRNDEHVEKAQELGIEPVEKRNEVVSLVSQEELVQLQDSPYYVVREMDYSVPYVTQESANLLTLIGMRFHEALQQHELPPYRFVITSATRTAEDQEALGQVNVNAADKSSHEFGTTVDLHYREFAYVPVQDSIPARFWIAEDLLQDLLGRNYEQITEDRQGKLKALLGRVLREMQREGDVLVIYERLQPVYHITLGRPIQEPEVQQAVRSNVPDQPLASPKAAMAVP